MPLRAMRFNRPLHIMRHQVSSSDYQLCVQDGACRALDRGVAIGSDRPAVQVSWHDAQAYAGWLSRKTGRTYRLPSDAEWAFAAGSRFRDDGAPVDADDPSKRWLSRYERESERDLSDTTAYPFGKFGANEHGIEDLAGNVWEWTSTCFVRSRIDAAGNAGRATVNCGVRVAEGAHRAYVTDFIRDARAGGCAQGVPPANLGFRLVREEPSWVASVSARWGKVWAARS
ncbi:formylglycine-generating enzyme required for sulfatase activity [Bradyrhizobium japonicum]|nr:formylglycine-generating enzyme required for sulfatase activity [Bradyrhizobium japonicum]MCP1775884.1 formylglycine-generating enzyme required for sulfatase activity [Bradyrhizobium japonicum]MCP1862905.1 formylglycine-generating enzyme required for sulfatase activity [Bradyrhizobium japonicum]MCP1893759.1 formylglycine-generating enzyme required for sulfatase activity [Bradyrhizobium japonicum]MCP1961117.1 formylglycine-generating enzyme required for sulfatase activity [Bradyrhizobium japo